MASSWRHQAITRTNVDLSSYLVYVLWHSHETNFSQKTHNFNLYDERENYTFKKALHLPGASSLINIYQAM